MVTYGQINSNIGSVYYLGHVANTNVTFDIKNVFPNYAALSAKNFVFAVTSCNGGGPDANKDADAAWHPRNSASIGLSYDASTGVLSVTANYQGRTFTQFTGDVLLIPNDIKSLVD